MMLTKAEIEERLPKTLGRSVYEGTATREREALETALALYAERDEALEKKQADTQLAIRYYGEKQALLAENRLLVHWLNDPPMYLPKTLEEVAPLTAAEVERVKRLEAVAEAAKVFRDHVREGFDLDNPLTVMAERDALDAALAALETS